MYVCACTYVCIYMKGFSSCYSIQLFAIILPTTTYQLHYDISITEKNRCFGKGAQAGDVNGHRIKKLNIERELWRTHHIQPGSEKTRGCESSAPQPEMKKSYYLLGQMKE